MSKYFTTSDGQEFYQEHDAKNHAKTLEDKTVTPPSIDVNDIEVEDATYLIDESSTDEGSTDEAPKDEAPKDDAPKEINLSKMKLVYKIVIFTFVFFNVIEIFSQETSNPKFELSTIAQANQGNSYITFPTDIGNMEPLIFEANLIPNFIIRENSNSKLMGVLTPQIIIRMYNQYSYPTKKDYQTNKKKNIELFEFDPNVISADEWIQLGISSWMAERILNYRNKGGKFKKKEDLLKTYGFKQEDYDRLEAFILIDTTNNYSKNNVIKTPFVISDVQELIEVNTAQNEQFMQLGFSAENAIRIIKFRETAGGIYSIDQLNSVFGIDMQSLENARTFLTVDKNHIIKININTVSFEQLANHVYISDELAQSIIDYRITTGKFYAITELMKVKGMYPSLFDKLKPYLIL